MIDLYTYGTSNGQRASVILEECELPYRPHKVDLAQGEQRRPEFLRLNPSGQIPVMVDHAGPEGQALTLAQSGAIILHCAEKAGRFLPTEGARRAHVLEVFAQVMTDAAPASAQIFYVTQATEPPVPEALTYFRDRFIGILGRLDQRLAGSEHLAGDEVSIADLALYPTIATRKAILDEAPGLSNLRRWAAAMALRPGVSRGMAVPE